jgi:hypothetical protein
MRRFVAISWIANLLTFLVIIIQCATAQNAPERDLENELIQVENTGITPAVYINNSSALKQLPAIIKDLTAVLNESFTYEKNFLNKNLVINLYDVNCGSFKTSALLQYSNNDSSYLLKLNRFNHRASDKALAVTLIHEIMHCAMIDIYQRAKRGEQRAVDIVLNFGLSNNGSNDIFQNEFFVLMNKGNEGQHELMHRLFYKYMVSLLDRFSRIHGGVVRDYRHSEMLMWSGLQATAAYKKLDEEEKKEIEWAIVKAKGMNTDPE